MSHDQHTWYAGYYVIKRKWGGGADFPEIQTNKIKLIPEIEQANTCAGIKSLLINTWLICEQPDLLN